MRTYVVLTPIHGLPRAEPWRAREPVAIDEVILLPDEVAVGLRQIGAIEPSNAAETCLLDFDEPASPALIASDDVDGLIAAVRNVGGVAKVIAAADVDELRAALGKLPESAGVVMPVDADPEDVLRQVSNFALMSEVHARVATDLLAPADVRNVLAALDAVPAIDAGMAGGDVVGHVVGFDTGSASDYSAAEVRLVVPAEAPASEPPAEASSSEPPVAPAAKKPRAKKAD